MSKIHAPFSIPIAVALNQAQTGVGNGMMIHPFTCAYRNDGHHGDEGGDTGVLIATPSGWVCPHCDYTQEWAYSAMAADAPDQAVNRLLRHRYKTMLPTVLKTIEAYQELQSIRPDAPGLAEMLYALEVRRLELLGNA